VDCESLWIPRIEDNRRIIPHFVIVCRRGEKTVDFAQSVLGGVPVEEKKHGGNAAATSSYGGLFDFAQNWSKRR
jgi:hypothetical protein